MAPASELLKARVPNARVLRYCHRDRDPTKSGPNRETADPLWGSPKLPVDLHSPSESAC
jgi:hypothetical protein